ncbi:ADP-ribosylglycohydrolase family protein [Cohnella hongkongensis]|uniref:ADP-ribosylglycohydrolase family protein n=1 Tax=Cohnella hongkongensis TaxID=178337 RepID=A0ABV9FBQ2_9BACL
MTGIPDDYPERVYAGWLGKVIGVRHGGNIEQWTYEQIARTFGEITTYLHQFKNFAADDDTNGPMFFLRALEDYTHTREIGAEQMGLTWLNYAPDGHGFYWWGGYGVSTEHTAYLNLKNGITAPRSGSIAQNGAAVAEQIGGQIFIDVWGLIAPGNPELAAEYAGKAASVSHDGNGKYGGMFIAACIAAAFTEKEIAAVLKAGLSVIPDDCEFAAMTRSVMDFHARHPEDWREAFQFVRDRYGYHLYPGNCHIIPNAAVIVLSLLYGNGDFSRSINICNMCGWDTDCNVANVGTIVGVLGGLAGIDDSWRKPIGDFLCCSSVIGTLNILDLPWCASYIARFGYLIAGVEPPDRWADIVRGQAARFHFEYPGSTHALRTDSDDPSRNVTAVVENTDACRATGSRSLKVLFDRVKGGYGYRVYHQTYYRPDDFDDSRYDPAFSPLLYPGQTISAKVMVPEFVSFDIQARMYIRDGNGGHYFYGEKTKLRKGEWTELSYRIPRMDNVCIMQAGIEWIPEAGWNSNLAAYVDSMNYSGQADYSIDFGKERMEYWNSVHLEVSQCTYLRGHWQLENGMLSGSYSGESAECYTGDLAWTDYSYEAEVIPQLGEDHLIQFRVQGGIRSYAAGFAANGRLALYKNDNGYRVLAETPCAWLPGESYLIRVSAKGNRYRVYIDGKERLAYTDEERPYLNGQIGFANFNGSRTHYKRFSVSP